MVLNDAAAAHRAVAPRGSFEPGSRLIDESSATLSVEQIRDLLSSSDVLPYGSQYAPTRWLMKAVWEVAHGPKPPLAAVGGGLRSAGEKDATVLDLYRKLSGDFGSPREEVCGTGERAHLRCTRSYVLSSQLRRWLNEIPAFVPLPSGWQPPPELLSGGFGSPRHDDVLGSPPRGPPPAAPFRRTPGAAPMAARRGAEHVDDLQERIEETRRSVRAARADKERLERALADEKMGSPPRRGGPSPPRRSSPDVVRRDVSVYDGPARAPHVLLGELLARLRERLYENMARPADLFRQWDRDGDGVISPAELLAGARAIGTPMGAGDDDSLIAAMGERLDGDALDFARFEEMLNPRAAYAAQFGAILRNSAQFSDASSVLAGTATASRSGTPRRSRARSRCSSATRGCSATRRPPTSGPM